MKLSQFFISSRLRITLVGLVGVMALGACAHPERTGEIYDPYEAANRAKHEGTKRTDTAVIRPMAQAYGETVPEPLRDTVGNFSNNIELPVKALNKLLQGDLKGAFQNSSRFLVNSTFGLAGLRDPASEMGIYEEDTGFGDTLAVWGVGEGAYLEATLIGPSTERDAIGSIVDFASNPLWYIAGPVEQVIGLGAKTSDKLNSRYKFGNTVDSILYDSADSYAQTRLLYLQNRRFRIGQSVAQSGGVEDDPYADPYDDPYADPYE